MQLEQLRLMAALSQYTLSQQKGNGHTPEITETGATDGIGRDFLANTSAANTTPKEQIEKRTKEDMNVIDITSTRKNAINLTTPTSMSAANTVISGNIDDSIELVDNISADGNGNIRNHTSRQEWSNPRVSRLGAYRTTNEKTTVDTQQKPYRSTSEEGEGELTNTLDVHIETQNTELNAHESAADHQQAPDITETGAADGIGQDFLANTSTTSTTPKGTN